MQPDNHPDCYYPFYLYSLDHNYTHDSQATDNHTAEEVDIGAIMGSAFRIISF